MSEEELSSSTTGGSNNLSSWKKRQVLICLCATNLFLNLCLAIMAPFYPAEAAKKHQNQGHAGALGLVTGLVFSSATFSEFLSAPFFGTQVPVVGTKRTLALGLILVGGTNILFGNIDSMDNWPMFLGFSIALRIVQGFGTAMVFTSSFSVLASTFPESVATVSGTLEVFSGLGFMVGPALGGWLYDEGGFSLPFYVVGGLMLAATPIVFILPPAHDCEDEKFPLSKLLRQPRIVLMLVSTAISACCLGFFDPTLGPFLAKNFTLSPSKIGLCFLLPGGIYTISAPIVGHVSDQFSTKPLIPVGLLMSGLAYQFLGPTPILSIQSHLWLSLLSLGIIGIGIALAMVPVSADMLETMHRSGAPATFELHSSVGGLLGAAFSFGEGFGPLLGGLLSGSLKFASATSLFGSFLLALAVFVTVFTIGGEVLAICRSEKPTHDIEDKTPLIQNKEQTVNQSADDVKQRRQRLSRQMSVAAVRNRSSIGYPGSRRLIRSLSRAATVDGT